MTGFGYRKVVVIALGACVAAVACGEEAPLPLVGPNTGPGGTGNAAAGSSSTAGSTQTAGTMSIAGTTSTAGTATTGGTAPTGGTSAGSGGAFSGGGKPQGGQASGGAGGDSAGEAGVSNGGAPGGAGGAGGQTSEEGGSGGEGGQGPQANNCVVASYGAVTPTDSTAIFDCTGEPPMVLNLRLQDGTPRDEIEISLYDGLGTFADGIKPGSYEIEGNDLDFKYCTLCVILYDQVTQFGGNRGWYMATGGTLTLTAVADRLTGSLTNATFRHVYEDNGGHSVPWADGCTTAVSKVDFDTDIVDVSPGGDVCG